MMVCITGMHRSGTSMVTRLLNICGLYLGPQDRMLPALADNPAGFWEDRAAVAINEAILSALGAGWDYLPPDLKPGWELDPALDQHREKARDLVATFAGKELWGWKDPRFCLTLPFWKPLLPDHRVVVCLRHPLAVADSLIRRNGHSAALGLHLWLEHYRLLLKHTDPGRRVVTHYDSYFPAPQGELSHLLTGLGWSVPQETIARAGKTVSDKLRHSEESSEQVAHVDLPAEVAALYEELQAEAGAGVPGTRTEKVRGHEGDEAGSAVLERNEELPGKSSTDIDHGGLQERDEPGSALHKARLDEAARLMEDGKPEAAAEICLDVLRENPLSEQAYYGLGLVAKMQGDHAGARENFQLALKQAPGSAPTTKRLAELDMIDGDMAAAQAGILGLLETDPTDIEGRHLLAQVLLQQGDFNEAIALIVGILNDDPQYWEAHLTMASLYDELERAEDVLEHVQAVLAIVPGQGDASQLLAKYSKKGTEGHHPD
ncbi:MAG: tetratricopeptide repeat protein [Candidatus Neomarinimicrobiota bacterium]